MGSFCGALIGPKYNLCGLPLFLINVRLTRLKQFETIRLILTQLTLQGQI